MAVYFILHVPKTSGVTIVEHLDENCARGVLWRPQRRFGIVPSPENPARVKAVALSHYNGKSLERHFVGKEIRRIVLLRDPVSLQISYYNWRMMHLLSRGLGTYSFDIHLRALPRNYMTNFLLRRWLEVPLPVLAMMPDAKKLALVQHSLAQFWFVGRHTDCDRLIATLAPELSVPPVAIARNGAGEWQEFVTWEPFTQEHLSPAKRSAILADHALDQLLWENWSDAGFDVQAVQPRKPMAKPRTNLSRALLRPAYNAERLWQRGVARPFPGSPILPRDDLRDSKATGLREALIAAPQNRTIWRDYLTYCRRARQAMAIPAALVGSLEDAQDPILCLLKAEVLLNSGRGKEARQFLRLAPALATNRRQARDIVLRASVLDQGFRKLVLRADRTRDRHAWQKGAALYSAALTLYPGHFGYRLQYANCLKELGDYTGAEIQCRSARALGASLQDIGGELVRVAAKIGYEEPAEGLAKRRLDPGSASLLDDPPTAADVELAGAIATGQPFSDASDILPVLRREPSIRSAISHLMAENCSPEEDTAFPTSLRAAEKTFLILTRELAVAAAKR